MVKTIKNDIVNLAEINTTLTKYNIPLTDPDKNIINYFTVKFIETHNFEPSSDMSDNKFIADLIWDNIVDQDIKQRKVDEKKLLVSKILYAKELEEKVNQILTDNFLMYIPSNTS